MLLTELFVRCVGVDILTDSNNYFPYTKIYFRRYEIIKTNKKKTVTILQTAGIVNQKFLWKWMWQQQKKKRTDIGNTAHFVGHVQNVL